MKVTQVIILMVLGIVLPLVAQLYDKRKLSEDARQRSWNIASWAGALYAFGPLSMLGWCWVTRRGWRRCIVGALYTGAILFLLSLIDEAMTYGLSAAPKPDILVDKFATLIGQIGAFTLAAAVLLFFMEAVSLLWRRRQQR